MDFTSPPAFLRICEQITGVHGWWSVLCFGVGRAMDLFANWYVSVRREKTAEVGCQNIGFYIPMCVRVCSEKITMIRKWPFSLSPKCAFNNGISNTIGMHPRGVIFLNTTCWDLSSLKRSYPSSWFSSERLIHSLFTRSRDPPSFQREKTPKPIYKSPR